MSEFDAADDIYSYFDTIAGCSVPIITKIAFKFNLNPTLTMGNHIIDFPGIGIERCFIGAECGCYIVHLPYRNAAQIRTKISNGASALQATQFSSDTGVHWRTHYQEIMINGEVAARRLLEGYHQRTIHDAAHHAPFRV